MVEGDPCVEKITIEITETAVINNYQVAIANLHRYKALGFGISLDDFGTGYSSLLHIKNIPVDELKIDRVFVSSIESCSRTLNIIGALVTLCGNMDMRLVAEGIETVSQRNILRSVGCQYVQGFLYSAPKSFEQIVKQVTKTEVA